MLTLDVEKYSQRAIDFKQKYKQYLLDAIDDKETELGEIYSLLSSDFLDKLLLYRPKEQYKLIALALKRFTCLEDRTSQEIIALKYIFIENGYDKIDKKEFYDEFGINSCIYCNRNYIFNLYTNGHIKGQIDHFYDKARYPFLAMSFYNLIPACEGCNRVKGSYDTFRQNSLSPYVRNEQKLFKTKIKSVDSFEYEMKEDNFLEKLLIQEIYNKGHIDIVNDMYEKFYQEETKEHFQILTKEFKNLNIKEEEIYRYLTNGYHNKDDFHKRTFSKLIKDISQELELL